nr:CRM-domain containing factor CFM3, chloroplastic/mitochondrial [Tanacetum cinerariifolium]
VTRTIDPFNREGISSANYEVPHGGMGCGVTREMVVGAKDKWKSEEVLKVKVTGSGGLNMKRMYEILEGCLMLHFEID